MMMDVNAFLTILLLIAGVVLLVVLIVLGIRCISILNKVDRLVDDVNAKMESVNGVI